LIYNFFDAWVKRINLKRAAMQNRLPEEEEK
jgi:hypothetical protein